MLIEEGKFYFLKDEFLEMFKNYPLMLNKENGNKRPCYFCFYDKNDKNIIWFVPISSKVNKYKKIYDDKIKTRKKVYNFVFGSVLGKERVFLIQNIFPTTIEFIQEKYVSKNQDVKVTNALKNEIIKKAVLVIKLAKQGINIPFYDIIEMKKILLKENNYK